MTCIDSPGHDHLKGLGGGLHLKQRLAARSLGPFKALIIADQNNAVEDMIDRVSKEVEEVHIK